MKLKRFTIVCVAIFLSSAVGLALALLYVYHHPATVKRWTEDALSARLGATATIGELTYGLQPMRVQAANITIRDADAENGLDLSVSRLDAAFALEGTFGRRTLVIERVALAGVCLTAGSRTDWRRIVPGTGPPSALSRVLQHASAALFFRSLRIAEVELSGGEAAVSADELTVELCRIQAGTDSSGIRVQGSARVRKPAAGALLELPQFTAVLALDASSDRNVVDGRLEVPQLHYTGPAGNAVASQAVAQLALALEPERIAIADGRVSLRSFALDLPGTALIALQKLRLNAAAEFKRGPGVLKLTRWRLTADQLVEKSSGMRAEPFEIDLSAEGRFPLFSIPQLEIRIPAAELPVSGRVYALNELHLRAPNSRLHADTLHLSCPEIVLASDLLRNLEASLAADPRTVEIEASGSGTGWAEAAARWRLLPEGWRLAGADRLRAKAVIRPGGESLFSATLGLAGFSFENAAGSIVGDDIALQAEVSVRTHPDEEALTVAASLRSGGGEFLWDRFYLNPGSNPATLSAGLRYTVPTGRLQVDNARLELEGLLSLDARGHMVRKGSHLACDLTLVVPPAPAAPLFAAFVAEPLRYRQPALAGVKVDGLLAAQVHLDADGDRLTLRGHADWQSGSAASASGGIRLEGIEMRLPLWYQSGGVDSGLPPMEGKVAVRHVSVPMLPAQGLALAFNVLPNRVDTAGEVQVRFPAGSIRIGKISGRELFGPNPIVRTDLSVDRVGIGEFLKDLWTVPVEAVVSGGLKDIVFDGRDVRTRGRLVVDIFKGRIIIRDPGVGAVLSAAPNLRADCRVQSVDLAEATQGTSFGRIQGVLGGRIEGLEIVGGQPQRFALLLETVRTAGVPQRINVEAVETIARIGGGQSPFVGLAGNLASFFKEFTYDKIGVRAVLENDLFKINGTISEGGVEYLVKKGGIPGVDVVNLNPVNRISFKDMLKRIRRVTESQGGPVVD